jgi:hypothetical protein
MGNCQIGSGLLHITPDPAEVGNVKLAAATVVILMLGKPS